MAVAGFNSSFPWLECTVVRTLQHNDASNIPATAVASCHGTVAEQAFCVLSTVIGASR